MAGFVFRENRVPHYQALFQRNDGIRQWSKTPRSKFYLLPFYVGLWSSLGLVTYAMGRQVLGHKTWFGEK